jgi:hypothetical protein
MNLRLTLRLTLPSLACAALLGACSAAAAALGAGGSSGARVWHESLTAPAQFDLTLAEISFGAPSRVAGVGASRAPHRSPIQLALRGTTGLNYVAGAVTRFTVRGRPRALVLIVNRRPRGSLAADIARIGITVTATRRLVAPILWQVSNPFNRRATGLTPALCDLPIRGASLTAGDLRAVLSRGLALTGAHGDSAARFGAEAAVAQAYDAICGRPYDPSFRQAVTQGSGPGCQPAQAGSLCCPPNAMCVPLPCPPCPCGPARCPVPVAGGGRSALACPLARQPVACRL